MKLSDRSRGPSMGVMGWTDGWWLLLVAPTEDALDGAGVGVAEDARSADSCGGAMIWVDKSNRVHRYCLQHRNA